MMPGMSEAEDIMYQNGFVRCDIAACGCGSWHARYGLRERFDELNQAMSDAGEQLNGITLLGAVQVLIAERDALRKDAERWRVMRDHVPWTMVSNMGIARVAFRVPVEWENVTETGDDLNDLADAALARFNK